MKLSHRKNKTQAAHLILNDAFFLFEYFAKLGDLRRQKHAGLIY